MYLCRTNNCLKTNDITQILYTNENIRDNAVGNSDIDKLRRQSEKDGGAAQGIKSGIFGLTAQ